MGMAIRWSKCGRKLRKVFLIQRACPNLKLGRNNPLHTMLHLHLFKPTKERICWKRGLCDAKQLNGTPYPPNNIIQVEKSLPNSKGSPKLGQNNPLLSSLHLQSFDQPALIVFNCVAYLIISDMRAGEGLK